MFTLLLTLQANTTLDELKKSAYESLQRRLADDKSKSSAAEGLFKQVRKTLDLLVDNPRHPGLNTHEFSGYSNPFNAKEKVFEAYAQNKTSGAYRVFWCYGPKKGQLTIIAITPHP